LRTFGNLPQYPVEVLLAGSCLNDTEAISMLHRGIAVLDERPQRAGRVEPTHAAIARFSIIAVGG
jgi:hypothetical protein